jgi:hypothetical protein
MLAIMACTVAYWHVQGVANPLLTPPQDSWFVLRLLPTLVSVGYIIPAFYFLAKHRRLSRQLH